jgi:copper oxidase (laccase) domain-containing protein
MDQVHGAEVRTVESGGRYECDGIFTGLPELALVVRTADCLPLIFFSESKRVAGAVHMGWRSAAAGIIGNIPFDLSSFVCIAGVGLRSCCFRVSGDFLGQERTLPFTVRRGDASYFDPVEFARRSLIGRGLKQDCFYDAGICSYCSREGFHSHRKDGTADRTLSFIVRS